MNNSEKVTHRLCFRCLICKRAFLSEEGVLKHLGSIHGDSDSYTTFVSKKRPQSQDKQSKSSSSVRAPNVPFKCIKCGLGVKTYDEGKKHLETDHGVRYGIAMDLLSYTP